MNNQGITIGVIKKQNSGGSASPTLPDVFLGNLSDTLPLSDLLDKVNLTVEKGTIPVVFVTGEPYKGSQSIVKRYLWKLGAGEFNPIGGENIESKLELIEETFLSNDHIDIILSSENAQEIALGVIAEDFISYMNNNGTYALTNVDKTYIVTFTKDDIDYAYIFQGTLGVYGVGNLKFVEDDFIFIYKSENQGRVNDFLEFANLSAFPITGETGKIYLALDSNNIYRWSGSVYVKISDSVKLDKVTTAGVERVYTINADGSQGNKPTSNFKDVIEGYYNGTNFYTDALFTNLITPESGRVYVALNLNSTYRWSGSGYVDVGGTYNPSFWLVDKLVKTSSTNFTDASLNGGNFFGGSSPNPSSFKTMVGIGIMSGTNANGGGRYRLQPANAIRPTAGLSFYSCFNLANTTRDNVIKIGFYNVQENVSPVIDGFWLQINGVNATLNTANGLVTSQSPSSALTNVYLECLLEYVSPTEVKCKIKEILTGNVVFNQTLTTNIPTTAKTFSCGLIATITTAGASNTICSIQELSFGIKPNFLNNF